MKRFRLKRQFRGAPCDRKHDIAFDLLLQHFDGTVEREHEARGLYEFRSRIRNRSASRSDVKKQLAISRLKPFCEISAWLIELELRGGTRKILRHCFIGIRRRF